VIFNTGTDEHGQKIYQKAVKEDKDPQSYCDYYADQFANLRKALDLSYDSFIRTTDKNHKKAAQHFWKRCQDNGDIYKAPYQVKYCVGCELEKTESELVDGRCPVHPSQELEILDEENYFFSFSKYQEPLLSFYKQNPTFVVPAYRYQEIQNFVQNELRDFSISRVKSKMPWGVPVPGDEEHVMYVWFDALINYISTLGWPEDKENFQRYWPGVQIAGKDNLRQQSAMWQAMLLSAGLPPSKQIYVEGFITVDGQKMSKTTGNVVDPYELVETYGTDAVRYYLLKEIPAFDDGDFSCSRMKEIYNAELSNEIGNLLSRLTNLARKDELTIEPTQQSENGWEGEVYQHLKEYQFSDAIAVIWNGIRRLNKEINDAEPWRKDKQEREPFLKSSLQELQRIGSILELFLPETGKKIVAATTGTIAKSPPLFPKIV
jgi:methionyl-tRNA synthetase